jgi:uncharacterized membrane protein
MSGPASHLVLKTRLLTVVVILSNVLGNFFLSWGLKHGGGVSPGSPFGYLEALFRPWVALGVSLLILWLLSRMALLSWADLSYVLPITAIGYVLTALMGKVFLLEHISWQRWSGTLLIVAGVALVSATPLRTTQVLYRERRGA